MTLQHATSALQSQPKPSGSVHSAARSISGTNGPLHHILLSEHVTYSAQDTQELGVASCVKLRGFWFLVPRTLLSISEVSYPTSTLHSGNLKGVS